MKMDGRIWKRAVLMACLFLSLSLVTISSTQAMDGAYATAVMETEGLLAYYRFDGDTGNFGSTCTDEMGINDGTYEDNHATPSGYSGFDLVPGAPISHTGNMGIDFANRESGIDIGTVPGFVSSMDGGYPGTTGATVEFWIKGDVNEYCKLMGMQKSGIGLRSQFAVHLDPDSSDDPGQIGCMIALTDVNGNPGGSSPASRVAGGVGVDDGEWRYVAITIGLQWGYENVEIGSQRYNLYVGTPGETEVVHYTYPDNEPTGRFWGTADDLAYSMYLGGMYNPIANDSYLNYEGMMDEVAFYSEALTLEQIQEHFDIANGKVPGDYPGDANRDGEVNVSDLGILATNYGATGGMKWEDADFTYDGAVDVSDLGLLATNYGTYAPQAAAVPEPSAALLLASMALCLCLQACRGKDE